MRPPIQYFGAKGNLAVSLVSMMPAHRGYIEPFAGSLAVLLAKQPSKIEVVNDLDMGLMTFWRVLRERPDDLVRVCAMTPHSRAELMRVAANLEEGDDLERARKVFVLLTQGRSRTLRRTGWRFYADASGTSIGFHKYLEAYLGRLAPAAARLMEVSLECRPAIEIVRQYGAFEDNLLYVDPPYMHSTLGGSGSRYAVTMSDDEHRELLEALLECRAMVMLSSYDNWLYDSSLSGKWASTELRGFTGNALSGSQARREILWSNFVPEYRFEFGDVA